MRGGAHLLAAALGLCLAAQCLLAQTQVQGRTDAYYDCTSQTVYATASMDSDYNTQYYYGTQFVMSLRKNGNPQAGGKWGYDPGQYGSSTIYASISSATSNDYFDAITWYNLKIEYITEQIIPTCLGCNDWYDAYGYDSIASAGDEDDGGFTFSVWKWEPPIIVTRIITEIIQLGNGGAAADVPGSNDVFDVKWRAFIPTPYVYGPDTCVSSATGVQRTIYHGDNRSYDPYSFAVRTHSEAIVRASTGTALVDPYIYTGRSKRYASDALSNGQLIEDSTLHDCHLLDDQGFAATDNMHVSTSGTPGTVSVNFYGGAGNPVSFAGQYAPDINWNVAVSISANGVQYPRYSLTYTHDCFPAYELYVGHQRLYGYMPSNYHPEIFSFCLLGVAQVSGSAVGVIF